MNIQIKNSTERYGWVAMLLHWLMVVLIFAMLSLGLTMVSLPNGDPKWGWYGLHKSIGLLVFILLLFRFYWRSKNITPSLPQNLNTIEKALAHITHYGIYAMLFALPISGYIDSCAGGYHLAFFDWFDIPKLIPKDKELEKLVVIIHQISAYTLIGLLLMHIGAAFKHHFILKDNILLRMLPTNLRK